MSHLERSTLLSCAEHSIDLLGGNPLHLLGYMALAAKHDESLPAPIAIQPFIADVPPEEHKLVEEIVTDGYEYLIGPKGLVEYDTAIDHPVPHYVVVRELLPVSQAAAGALLDWQRLNLQHSLADILNQPLLCLDVYGLLLQHSPKPVAPQTLYEALAEEHNFDTHIVSDTLDYLLSKEIILKKPAGHSIAPSLTAAIADLLLRRDLLARSPSFAARAAERGLELLHDSYDNALLVNRAQADMDGTTLNVPPNHDSLLHSLTLQRLPIARHWRNNAACKNIQDKELFFPLVSGNDPIARRVCRACPVWGSCLQWALDTGQTDGIYGGLDHEERRELRRKPATSLALKTSTGERSNEEISELLSAYVSVVKARRTQALLPDMESIDLRDAW